MKARLALAALLLSLSLPTFAKEVGSTVVILGDNGGAAATQGDVGSTVVILAAGDDARLRTQDRSADAQDDDARAPTLAQLASWFARHVGIASIER